MSQPIYMYALAAVCLILLATSGYFGYQYRIHQHLIGTLEQNRSVLESDYASTTNTLTTTLMKERELASSTIADLAYRLAKTEDALEQEQNRNEDFENQIKAISGTVKVLDRLAKTDKELLQKYSRIYFLNENYIPERLTQIDQKYVQEGKKDQYFHTRAISFLTDMLDDAAKDGIELKVVSAYRSFDEQTELKGQYTQIYGSGANSFSADQGYSEHQLGTTLDLTDPATAGPYGSFAKTAAYQWLLENAHKYGFVLSYPEDNTYYIYEPWHWRFVGQELARDLKKADAHLYDWEQRKIDEYLVNIFE